MEMPVHHGSAPDRRGRTLATLDRTGTALSAICAVHCVLMPLVLAVIPLGIFSFLAAPGFEAVIFASAAIIAAWSACWGWFRHGNSKVVLLFAFSLALFGGTRLLFDHDHAAAHGHLAVHESVLLGVGGALLAVSHWLNHRLCRSCQRCAA